jgi:hypothetical protein
MKTLFIISFSLLSFNCFCQNRWMFLNKGEDGGIYLVDTLSKDTQELSSFDKHYSVVIIWTDIYKKTYSKNGNHVHEYRYKIAIDTAAKQYETKVSIEYKDGEVVNDNKNDEIDWADVIPDTMGEDLIKYALALDDNNLMKKIQLTALFNYNPYDPKTLKYKK